MIKQLDIDRKKNHIIFQKETNLIYTVKLIFQNICFCFNYTVGSKFEVKFK